MVLLRVSRLIAKSCCSTVLTRARMCLRCRLGEVVLQWGLVEVVDVVLAGACVEEPKRMQEECLA
jgi:hypothetical protein